MSAFVIEKEKQIQGLIGTGKIERRNTTFGNKDNK